ncbi:MAG: hypothetical protein KAT38_02955 [Bacteroidales bacterium]|nr:hypothetical protein [Bacteroidales bacterium]
MNPRKSFYFERGKKYEKLEAEFQKKLNRLVISRLIVFIGGVYLSYLSINYNLLAGLFILFLFLVVFLRLIIWHIRTADKKEHFSILKRINKDEESAMSGDWSEFEAGNEFVDTTHPFSYDLDLFGNGSLYQYINRTCTPEGRKTLGLWFISPLLKREDILEKQEALNILKERIEWRQEFQTEGVKNREMGEDKRNINEWVGSSSSFVGKPGYEIIRYLLPVLTISSVVLSAFSLIPSIIPALFVICQLTIIGFLLLNINRQHSLVSRRFEVLKTYSRIFSLIENENFGSSYLDNKQSLLRNGSSLAGDELKALANIIRAFDTRLNMLAGVIMNALFLWDIHCMIKLEKWRNHNKKLIPVWFEVIGEFDALNSLAGFAFNNPDYPFPEVADKSEPVMKLDGAGHPLIEYEKRVKNSFEIASQGKLTIITGANMAGKSTFLRTVGVNHLLALTGAPVCAEKAMFSVMGLFSSMRTTDSLRKNESYFYAELKRLKELKDRLINGEKLLFILDEILKGTNSEDKHKGSVKFLKKLIGLKSTGLIATHDKALGALENEFPEQIVNKCFEIVIDGKKIHFDYKLRNGITQKMNAELLMEQMGILS